MKPERLEELTKIAQNNDLDKKLQDAVIEISQNHHKIIDDWCKAYLAQLYEEGIDIKPGCFTLHQQQFNDGINVGWKYWFNIENRR